MHGEEGDNLVRCNLYKSFLENGKCIKLLFSLLFFNLTTTQTHWILLAREDKLDRMEEDTQNIHIDATLGSVQDGHAVDPRELGNGACHSHASVMPTGELEKAEKSEK